MQRPILAFNVKLALLCHQVVRAIAVEAVVGRQRNAIEPQRFVLRILVILPGCGQAVENHRLRRAVIGKLRKAGLPGEVGEFLPRDIEFHHRVERSLRCGAAGTCQQMNLHGSRDGTSEAEIQLATLRDARLGNLHIRPISFERPLIQIRLKPTVEGGRPA